MSKTIINPGGNEQLDLDIDLTDTTTFVQTSSGAGDSGKVPRLGASGTLAAGFLDDTDITTDALYDIDTFILGEAVTA